MRHVSRPAAAVCAALFFAFVVIVFVYRMDVQQGNLLDGDQVEQLEVGMTRSQVRFSSRHAVVIDSFFADRWVYVYSFFRGIRAQSPFAFSSSSSTATRSRASKNPFPCRARETSPQAEPRPIDLPSRARRRRRSRGSSVSGRSTSTRSPARRIRSPGTSCPKIPMPQTFGSMPGCRAEYSRKLDCVACGTALLHLEGNDGLALSLRAGDFDCDGVSRHRIPAAHAEQRRRPDDCRWLRTRGRARSFRRCHASKNGC